MQVSLKECIWRGEKSWEGYDSLLDLSRLTRIRTRDASLNPYVVDPIFLYSPDEDVLSALQALPDTDGTLEYYYLLAVDLEEQLALTLPESALFLGYDVSDNTGISSLLNCWPWRGKLLPITKRLNHFGLLTLCDAQLAQKLLPEEWGEDVPHAFVDIWALYDVTNMRSVSS